MYDFFINLLSCSVTMSILSLLYIAVTPILSKKYTAKWLYYIWLLIVMGWLFPLRPNLGICLSPFQISETQITRACYIVINKQMNMIAEEMGGNPSFSVWQVLVILWVLGMAVALLYHSLKHRSFLKVVRRWSKEIKDQEILHKVHTLKEELGIQGEVGLKTCLNIESPMMIGFFQPTILLPSVNVATDDLIFILRHELIHMKRKDLWYKALIILATSIHWFNPVVYFLARAINIQCEISCDEKLIKETDINQRRKYGETLLDAVRKRPEFSTVLSTDFYSVENVMRVRLFRIMDTTKKNAGILIMFLVFIAVIGSGAAYASNKDIGYSKHTQVINVDIKAIKKDTIICFKGPYQLEAGDIIQADIDSDQDNSLCVEFIQCDTIVYGESIYKQNFSGYILAYPGFKDQIDRIRTGDFSILVKFKNFKAGQDIKGTIKIIRGEEK